MPHPNILNSNFSTYLADKAWLVLRFLTCWREAMKRLEGRLIPYAERKLKKQSIRIGKDKRLTRYLRQCRNVSVCIDPIHSVDFSTHALCQWLVHYIISPLCDKLNVFPDTAMSTITSEPLKVVLTCPVTNE